MSEDTFLTPEQVKMAIAAMNWSNRELSENAGLGIATVARYATGDQISLKTSEKIKKCFTKHGLTFIAEGEASATGGPGVRLSMSFDATFYFASYHFNRFFQFVDFNKDVKKQGPALKSFNHLLHADVTSGGIDPRLAIVTLKNNFATIPTSTFEDDDNAEIVKNNIKTLLEMFDQMIDSIDKQAKS